MVYITDGERNLNILAFEVIPDALEQIRGNVVMSRKIFDPKFYRVNHRKIVISRQLYEWRGIGAYPWDFERAAQEHGLHFVRRMTVMHPDLHFSRMERG